MDWYDGACPKDRKKAEKSSGMFGRNYFFFKVGEKAGGVKLWVRGGGGHRPQGGQSEQHWGDGRCSFFVRFLPVNFFQLPCSHAPEPRDGRG